MSKVRGMESRPILFSTPMVQALLAARKVQTRRIVKRNPAGRVQFGGRNWHLDDPNAVRACPYGQPGNLLWVRETWAAPHAYDHLPPRMIPQHATIHYAATEERGGLLWRPSIHMPRWASRLILRITDVGVERLQSISGMDAKREGAPVPAHIPEDGADMEWARGWYRLLWDDINGDGAWDANPWVWAISFDVISANVDSVTGAQK